MAFSKIKVIFKSEPKTRILKLDFTCPECKNELTISISDKISRLSQIKNLPYKLHPSGIDRLWPVLQGL